MFNLKCTQLVQKAIGLHKDDLVLSEPSQAPLGNWYTNRFDLGRRKAYIFMSETTLLSFILLQEKKPITIDLLPQVLLAGLEQLLDMKGLPKSAIDRALMHCDACTFTKTENMSDLGSLNDLVSHYKWRVNHQGGLSNCNITDITMSVNSMPQKRLAWQSSWDAVHNKLA
jgi:hypothetical protein